ncbi:MAG TPA: class I SAM-dependent methyltransferase [Bryobacteraceae bacterium]|jgi:trans-aconitate methyltransferase|nr:class I SAM-dependent methyltransferase [Bryobacteraceae bacterium]
MSAKQNWDAELYEARHSFVWQLAGGVLELLAPKSGERILDVGCGPGQLTHKIAEAGATVVGVDAAPEMIGQARQNFPGLTFSLQDVRKLTFQEEFDAVFSNATLHWVPDAHSAARSIAAALKPGGRFAAEFGGSRNVFTIESAVRRVLARYTSKVPDSPRYYPTIGQYAAVLEAEGFEVRLAQLFDRPTPLEGDNGIENWIRQFEWFCFEALEPAQRTKALTEIVEELRPTLYRDRRWYADYRRLRVLAIKN